jgi:hypothetical protein
MPTGTWVYRRLNAVSRMTKLSAARGALPLRELYSVGTSERHRFETQRKAYLCPRSVAFNVHGVRLAVSRQSA